MRSALPAIITGLLSVAVACTPDAPDDRFDRFVGVACERFVLRARPADAPRGEDAAGGTVLHPWGFNYDRTVIAGRDLLLEEALRDHPGVVREDLAAMVRLNGNLARVFLSTGAILSGPDEVNPRGIDLLERLLEAARDARIRLILVGLAMLDPAQIPPWLRDADDDTMRRAARTFWHAVASHCRNEPVVFAYDLQNEPAIPWTDTEEWVTGCFDMPAGRRFCYVHRPLLRPGLLWTRHVHQTCPDATALAARWPDFPRPGESWEAVAIPAFDRGDPRFNEYFAFHAGLLSSWAEELAAVVRTVDPNHLVTIGALHPAAVAEAVDFHCFHLYPETPGAGGDFLAHNRDRWRQQLQTVSDGKPVMIEEFYPMWTPPDEIDLSDLLEALLEAAQPRATGFLSFYWGPPGRQTWTRPQARRLYESWLQLWQREGLRRRTVRRL